MKKICLLYICSFSLNCFGQFGNPTIIDNNAIVEGQVSNIITADIDNDGLKDIIVGGITNYIKWYRNIDGTNFSSSSIITNTSRRPFHLDTGDINGDGFADILVTGIPGSFNGFGVGVFININGGQSWVYQNIDSNLIINAFKSFFIDVENDGDLDIVTNGDATINLYINNGLGVYSAANVIFNNGEFYNMTVADFNNDGFKDLAVNSLDTLVFLNNTINGFDLPYSINNLGIRIFLTAIDIDNDSSLDIAYQNEENDQEIKFYKNDGSGLFTYFNTESNSYTSDQLDRKYKFCKIDSDNSMDLLYVNQQGFTLKWRQNNSLGIFLNDNLINADYFFRTIFPDDIDNDGDNDIVWYGANSSGNYIGLLKNESNVLANNENAITKNFIAIVPNPSSNTISVESNFPIIKIDLITIFGQTVLTSSKSNIDISNIATGMYVAKIEDINNKIYFQKIIKN